jgi:hypothetical protein
MKITKRRLRQIIKEEVEMIREQRALTLPGWTHLEIIDDYLSDDGKQQLVFVRDSPHQDAREASKQLTRLVSSYLRHRPDDREAGDYFSFREEMYGLFGHIDAGGTAPGLEIALQILKASNAYPGPGGPTEVDMALRDYEQVRNSAAEEVGLDAMAAGDDPPDTPAWSGGMTSTFE